MSSSRFHAAYPPLDRILSAPISECIPADRSLTVLHHASTVSGALSVLSEAKILSAPVMKTNPSGDIEWIAFVSSHDLCQFLANKTDEAEALQTTLDNVIPFASSPPLQVEGRTKIIDVISFLSSSGRMHRCIVVNRGRNSIASQSDINRYVVNQMFKSDELQLFGQVQLGDLGFACKPPASIRSTATLGEALTTLMKKKASCLAIVDENEKLIGNFSSSDIVGTGIDVMRIRSQPVVNFLTRRSPGSLTPISISPTESLGVVMARLANSNLHHVFIQEPGGRPQGFVSLTDICNLLIKFDPKAAEAHVIVPKEAEVDAVV